MPFITAKPSTIKRVFPPATLPGITEGDWIEFDLDMTAAKQARIQARSFPSRYNRTTKSFETTFDSFGRRMAALEEVVTNWSDTEHPYSPDLLGELHPDVHSWLAAEWDRLSAAAGRSEEEKKG